MSLLIGRSAAKMLPTPRRLGKTALSSFEPPPSFRKRFIPEPNVECRGLFVVDLGRVKHKLYVVLTIIQKGFTFGSLSCIKSASGRRLQTRLNVRGVWTF